MTRIMERINGEKVFRELLPSEMEPTPEQREAERQTSVISRHGFCLNLVRQGILTSAQAVEAAKGTWPPVMDDFLTYLDANQALDAQIEWATSITVIRVHPFIRSLSSWLSLTEEDTDKLFEPIT